MEHQHVPMSLVDAPKIDENEVSEGVEFIDEYIRCTLPGEAVYPKLSNSVKKVQTHHSTTFCRKKMVVAYRFNAS